ncbi:MAG: DNA topoisomerase (ATP-hydrolyzing) [bacterium]|nr:MAG: DNA topoisomerase (ATP-hydrolyzing) [bacterium]
MKQMSLLQGNVQSADLKSELRKRFLSYAVSTIAARALPDVRDGLKPVHRRILYAMYRLRLTPDNRYRKSAAVVGDVLGKYHPHGDQAAYDTMVRLAQEFSLRYPLVDGQGNFGSVDGDSAAAMRYTEARLTKIAIELLKEIDQDTVPFRPNYDGTQKEPVFLPSRIPNLIVNGSSGIAVGIATNIPPHNLSEVINALIALIDNSDLTTAQIQRYIKGPDFPTGAAIIATKKELRNIYNEGRGGIKIRGEYAEEIFKRGKKQIVITSLPYTVNKSRLVEKIASLIIDRKTQLLTDVRDESTEIIRIALEPKPGADTGKIMAYLYRYTDLEYNFAVNLTALDTTGAPRRMTLLEILETFIRFRVGTTELRLKHDLGKILERLHILNALLSVLKNIDAAIAIIRKSKSREEAKTGLKKKFRLDDVQAGALLDLRLSSLVLTELEKVRLEAAELEAKREMIEKILKSKRSITAVVKKELLDIKKEYGDARKTRIAVSAVEEEEYSAQDFVEHEPCFVVVSRNGWIRRVKNDPNKSQLRLKEGDSLLKTFSADTAGHVGFLSSAGKIYVTRIYNLPQTTGFGDPVQTLFKFGDGERIVAVDHFSDIQAERKAKGEFLVVMENGQGLRFSRDAVTETTRAGKRFANVKGDNLVFDVIPVEKPLVYITHSGGKGLLFRVMEVPLLSGPGAGARLIKKLKPGENVTSLKNVDKKDTLRFVFDKGRDALKKVSAMDIGRRAAAGRSYGGAKKKLIAVVSG